MNTLVGVHKGGVVHDPAAAARVVIVLFAVTVVVGALPSPAHARHNFSMLDTVEPRQVEAGETVSISGFSYHDTVEVRFGALDGPVLTELEPTENDDIAAEVRIPPDTDPGRYVLYAVQRDEEGNVARFPGQAAVWVTGDGGLPLDADTPELEARPAGLVMAEDPGLGSLWLVAVATAGLAAGVGVVSTWALARRGRARDDGQATS